MGPGTAPPAAVPSPAPLPLTTLASLGPRVCSALGDATVGTEMWACDSPRGTASPYAYHGLRGEPRPFQKDPPWGSELHPSSAPCHLSV